MRPPKLPFFALLNAPVKALSLSHHLTHRLYYFFDSQGKVNKETRQTKALARKGIKPDGPFLAFHVFEVVPGCPLRRLKEGSACKMRADRRLPTCRCFINTKPNPGFYCDGLFVFA